MDCISLIKQLSTYPAISGNEKNLSQFIKQLFQEYCDTVEVDQFYNVKGIMRGENSNAKKVMITAHMDEIGFLVKSIDERGFIKFANIGGIDSRILLAQEVVIHGKKDIIGVIGAKPPHLLTVEEVKKAVSKDELSIDTGMKAEEVKKYISVGDIITLMSEPVALNEYRLSSKSLDNKAGVVALLGIMKELSVLKHQSDIYFVATTQEETELTGAITTAYKIQPDIAIVVDVCHGDMPEAPKDEIYTLGKGPSVGVGPILHSKLSKKIIDIAKEQGIPYQIDVEPGDTGTEAWATQVSRNGIPTALISIPLRYMHTAVETIDIRDINNTARLIARFVAIKEEELEGVLCF
ncbi:MAG: M42 family metallopeptidase [Clostridia bacterium]|nr:M42 family metallopeptidase [Clostridia bacterium]